MALFRDVYPVAHQPQGEDMDQCVRDISQLLWRKGHIRSGDRVIVTMGDTLGREGGTNTLRLIKVGPDGYAENQSRQDLH
jgi:pyruvate kinase